MELECLDKYNKNDIQLGDIYVYSYSFLRDDFKETTLVEVVADEIDGHLYLKPIKADYWKQSYALISNDYLTDFEAIRVYRHYN